MSSLDGIGDASTGSESRPIRSERRGAHGVAWLAADHSDGPADSVLIVGQDQAEAEKRCREWWSNRRSPVAPAPAVG